MNIDFAALFESFPPEISVLLISMIPIAEMRASIPIALSVYNLPLPSALFFSIIGNIVPVIIILIGIDKIYQFLSKRSKLCKNFFEWFFARTRDKFAKKYSRYGEIALILFVAIPLPFTGAWTGSVAAFLYGIPFKKSFMLIVSGMLLSSLIISLLSLGIISIIYF
ncbi:small multi-drug export protein [Candidatus Parcubacteria bacterium]|nr:small multi-drug export protein [Candidatus Parcubacteria bacterium]